MSERCPTCGAGVAVVSSDEGTSFYVLREVVATRQSLAAHLEELAADGRFENDPRQVSAATLRAVAAQLRAGQELVAAVLAAQGVMQGLEENVAVERALDRCEQVGLG